MPIGSGTIGVLMSPSLWLQQPLSFVVNHTSTVPSKQYMMGGLVHELFPKKKGTVK